ncbi:MAG: DUF1080 domain-containing protein [Planctomycetota bacterium]|nr:DUF1080 domain-containing protein [Planctomycetota bacterium]
MTEHPNFRSHRRAFLATSLIGAAQWSFLTRISQGALQEDSSVFKGESLDGWMTLEGQVVRTGWQAKGGEIFLKRGLLRAGHIITRKEFGDFELSFDWKIAKGGNSGIKYRVRKYGDRMLGCEYQIYDPNGQKVDGKNKTASLYDLYEPDESIQSLPVGQWNSAKISVREGKIEHWLNGSRVVMATVSDNQWKQKIAQSKFNDAEKFGENRCGRIMLTDHGSDVHYRNFQFTSFEPNC